MFFHFQVLFHTVLFFAVLEFVVAESGWIVALSVLLIGSTVIGVRRIGKSAVFSIIPITFAVAAVMLLYLIDSPQQKQGFIALSSLVFYISLLAVYRLRGYRKDQTARGLMAASVMAALFFFYAAAYGLYLNFSIPLWALMLAYLGFTFAVSFEYFGIVSAERRKALNYSLILGMAMSEIAWMTNFWPFGYLTTGVVTVIFYFIFWDLTQMYFLNTLSQKRIVANLIFFGVLIGLLLVTAKWLPIV
ncbi:hypothetical protein EPO05_04890 [Patescibacteria group bacterium]|nr:MAG: hypothetical protein EPO05_04890 [Patescibacteria group bacterium]